MESFAVKARRRCGNRQAFVDVYKRQADEGNCIDTRMEYEAVDGVIVGMVKKQG